MFWGIKDSVITALQVANSARSLAKGNKSDIDNLGHLLTETNKRIDKLDRKIHSVQYILTERTITVTDTDGKEMNLLPKDVLQGLVNCLDLQIVRSKKAEFKLPKKVK